MNFGFPHVVAAVLIIAVLWFAFGRRKKKSSSGTGSNGSVGGDRKPPTHEN